MQLKFADQILICIVLVEFVDSVAEFVPWLHLNTQVDQLHF